MNRTILQTATSRAWIFALLLVIFSALLVLPVLEHLPIIGNLIYSGIYVSLLFLAIYLRDAAYAFDGDDRINMKDVAIGFGLTLLGMFAQTYGGVILNPFTIIWGLAFGATVIVGGIKMMNGFGKLKLSDTFLDTRAAGNLKLAGIFILVVGIFGVLAVIPVIGFVCSIFWKIFLCAASIILLIGLGSLKKSAQ